MSTPKKKRNPPEKCQRIFDEPKASRLIAIESAKNHIDTKPIVFLLK